MALASVTACNQALDGMGGTVSATNTLAFAMLNSASPGTTGASELASTTRQASSWNAAASSAKTNSSALSFSTPGSTPATYFSTFSAVSAGTFGIAGALGSSVTAVTITVAAGALSIGAS